MTDPVSSRPELPDNIDLYPAGPEMDMILAERVLGARVRRHKEWTGYENWIATTPDGEELYIMVSPHGIFAPEPLWNPSTNLSDAQILVQHLFMNSDYRTMSEEVTEDKGHSVTLWAQRPIDNEVTGSGARPVDEPKHVQTYSVTGTGPTPALAICRAIYKAASGMTPRQAEDNN